MSYSERLYFSHPSISESLHSSFPSIDVLAISLDDHLKAYRAGGERIDAAVTYAEEQRRYFQVGYNHESAYLNPPQDVLSAFFLDSIIYLSRDYQYLGYKSNRNGSREDDHYLRKILSARHLLQDDINDYSNIFKDAPDELLYKGAEAIFYEAGCIINGIADLPEGKDSTRRALIGLLAEHKVLRGLKASGWEWAHYASITADSRFRSDILVPIGELRNKENIAIQVKALPKPGSAIAISQDHTYGVMVVEVPMNKDRDQFSLSKNERQKIAASVEEQAKLFFY